MRAGLYWDLDQACFGILTGLISAAVCLRRTMATATLSSRLPPRNPQEDAFEKTNDLKSSQVAMQRVSKKLEAVTDEVIHSITNCKVIV